MKAPILAVSALLVLGGCAGKGELDGTGGITAVRSACPSVAIPAATGDVTLFEGAGRRSEERRVGKECPVLCRSRWSPYH